MWMRAWCNANITLQNSAGVQSGESMGGKWRGNAIMKMKSDQPFPYHSGVEMVTFLGGAFGVGTQTISYLLQPGGRATILLRMKHALAQRT